MKMPLSLRIAAGWNVVWVLFGIGIVAWKHEEMTGCGLVPLFVVMSLHAIALFGTVKRASWGRQVSIGLLGFHAVAMGGGVLSGLANPELRAYTAVSAGMFIFVSWLLYRYVSGSQERVWFQKTAGAVPGAA